jgi:hypothetical protein
MQFYMSSSLTSTLDYLLHKLKFRCNVHDVNLRLFKKLCELHYRWVLFKTSFS